MLLAEKRFTARERRLFRADYAYRGVWGEGTYRENRAMKNNTHARAASSGTPRA